MREDTMPLPELSQELIDKGWLQIPEEQFFAIRGSGIRSRKFKFRVLGHDFIVASVKDARDLQKIISSLERKIADLTEEVRTSKQLSFDFATPSVKPRHRVKAGSSKVAA
jgi:hypothetical protein